MRLIARAALALLCTSGALANDEPAKQPISIEDLVGITRIRNTELSPNGQWVSYLTIEPLVDENRFDCTLWLQRTAAGAKPVEFARFRTTAEQTYLDTGALKDFGGQSAWSVDSRQLAYTRRAADTVEVRWRDLNGRDTQIAGGFAEAQIEEWSEDGKTIRFSTVERAARSDAAHDPSVLVTDETNFASLSWAKHAPATETRLFAYDLAARELRQAQRQDDASPILPKTYERAGWPTPPNTVKNVLQSVLSPDGSHAVFSGQGFYENRDSQKAGRDYFIGIKRMDAKAPPREFLHSPSFISSVHWSEAGGEALGIVLDAEYSRVVALSPKRGKVRELTRTPHALRNVSWSKQRATFVAVRQSTSMPDELVKFDSVTGRFEVLASPNARFADKEVPEVRFMRINNPLGGGIFGRLVFPNDYVRGKRYPLVFTTYRAGTGSLEGAVGDEFPIFPFAASGIVVFAMDTGDSNLVSDSGDLDFTLMRDKKPLEAMQVLRKQLADEGIIDPERCGVTGLSYGSDIATYAVTTTDMFRAASVSVSGHDPIVHTLGSVTFTEELAKRGLHYPDDAGRQQWKKMSLALNADRVSTPILIQSPESEAMMSLETFKALRRHQVPMEWYVYLNEGHVKFQPRSKYLVYRRNLDWMRFWLQDWEDEDPAKVDQYARWRSMRAAQALK